MTRDWLPVPSMMSVKEACIAAGVDVCTYWNMQNDGLVLSGRRTGIQPDPVAIRSCLKEYKWRRKYAGDYTPLIKTCERCGAVLSIAKFRLVKSRSAKYGYNIKKLCRSCENAKRARPSPDVARNYQRQWRSRPEVAARRKAKDQEKRKDPKHRLDRRISKAIRESLSSGSQWRDCLPYTLDELKTHIERQFLKGMSWENMEEWHIDHIIPKVSFKYSSPADPEFLACWALSNLRPLWAADNVAKGANRVTLL